MAGWLDCGAEECFVTDGLFMSRQSREAVLNLVPSGAVSARVGWFLDTPPQALIGRFRRRADAGIVADFDLFNANVREILYQLTA